MRICILSCFDDLLLRDTGPSVRILNLAKGIANRNHEVHILIPSANGKWCDRVDRVLVHGLPGFCPKSVLKALSRILGILRPTSILFHDLLFIFRASKTVLRCDLIQVEQPSAGGLIVLLASVIFGRSLIADCHDVLQASRIGHTSGLRRILETFLEKATYSLADVILTVSEKEKSILGSFRVNKQPIMVVHNGVDTDAFTPSFASDRVRKHYGLGDSRVVVFVGNMEYLPNQEAVSLIVSNIAPKVLKKVGDVKFLIIGRMPSRKLELQESPNVIFTGVVDDIEEVLALSDVAIAPLLHGSGTRLKVLEYFSCGLPVVSTTVGVEGIEVSNNLNVLIENDMDAFAEKIINVLEDRERAKNLGQAARFLVLKEYDWKAISEKLESIYHACDNQSFEKIGKE